MIRYLQACLRAMRLRGPAEEDRPDNRSDPIDDGVVFGRRWDQFPPRSAPGWLEYPPPDKDAIRNVLRNGHSRTDTEHPAGDATCPAARSGSATAYDGPAAADTASQS